MTSRPPQRQRRAVAACAAARPASRERCAPGHLAAHLRADPARAGDPDRPHPADHGLPADAGGPGRPDPGGARRHGSRRRSSRSARQAAGYDRPILDAVRRVPRRRRSRSTSARRSPTTARSPRSSSRTARATLELTFWRVHDRARRRDPARADRRAATATDLDRHRRADVRDRHLRGPGVLPRLPAPAPVRQHARLVTDLGPGEPDRRVRARQDHPLLPDRLADLAATGTRSGTSSST